MRTVALGLVAGIALGSAVAAGAQQPLSVYDSEGHQVGLFALPDFAIQKFGDSFYQFEVSRVALIPNGLALIPNVAFFYTMSNCQGTRYLCVDTYARCVPFDYQFSLVGSAFYEQAASDGTPASAGSTLWTASTSETVKSDMIKSFWYEDYFLGIAGHCYSPIPMFDEPHPLYVPAIAINRKHYGFTPPFCVGGRNGQPCRAK